MVWRTKWEGADAGDSVSSVVHFAYCQRLGDQTQRCPCKFILICKSDLGFDTLKLVVTLVIAVSQATWGVQLNWKKWGWDMYVAKCEDHPIDTK